MTACLGAERGPLIPTVVMGAGLRRLARVSVVVDASVIVALLVADQRQAAEQAHLERWVDSSARTRRCCPTTSPRWSPGWSSTATCRPTASPRPGPIWPPSARASNLRPRRGRSCGGDHCHAATAPPRHRFHVHPSGAAAWHTCTDPRWGACPQRRRPRPARQGGHLSCSGCGTVKANLSLSERTYR